MHAGQHEAGVACAYARAITNKAIVQIRANFVMGNRGGGKAAQRAVESYRDAAAARAGVVEAKARFQGRVEDESDGVDESCRSGGDLPLAALGQRRERTAWWWPRARGELRRSLSSGGHCEVVVVW